MGLSKEFTITLIFCETSRFTADQKLNIAFVYKMPEDIYEEHREIDVWSFSQSIHVYD